LSKKGHTRPGRRSEGSSASTQKGEIKETPEPLRIKGTLRGGVRGKRRGKRKNLTKWGGRRAVTCDRKSNGAEGGKNRRTAAGI